MVGWWVGGVDWWMGWTGGLVWTGGLAVRKLAAWGSEVCKSPLARATAMGRRIIMIIITITIIIIVIEFGHGQIYGRKPAKSTIPAPNRR